MKCQPDFPPALMSYGLRTAISADLSRQVGNRILHVANEHGFRPQRLTPFRVVLNMGLGFPGNTESVQAVSMGYRVIQAFGIV